MAKRTKWWSWIMGRYLYGAFDCMSLPCLVRIIEPIQTLYLPECEGTCSPKHERYLKFKWLKRECNPQPLNFKKNTQPLRQTHQMIELNCEEISVWSIWLYVIIMSRTHFRMYPQSVFGCMSRTSWSKQERYLRFKWLEPVSNPQPPSSSKNTQPFCRTNQMIELNCE